MLSKNKLKYLRSLSLKKNRDAEGCFLAEGPKVVGDLSVRFACKLLAATESYLSVHPGMRAEETVVIDEKELRAASFYYYVYGVSFGAGGQFYSEPSGIMPVQLPTKAESTVAHGLRLYAEPGQLTVVAVAESEAVIYDASGRAVQAARLAPGANTFALQPGLYFVRSGADTYKALLQ